MTYFKASGQYGRALKTILETQRDTVVRGSGYNNYVLTKELGDVYWHLRRMEQAAVNYREYIRLSDSVRNREIRTATDDFRESSKSAACTTKPRNCSTISSANACAIPI